jgi:4-hydroxyphenylacetate 3-monooxygenase
VSRSGSQFLQSLDDGRAVYLDGGRVSKVVGHPAFGGAARSIANLYDMQAAPENLEKMTFASPKTGDRVSRMWQLPTTYEELVTRREALTSWAETHFGFMGRSPDHVASTLAGFYMGSSIYEEHGAERAKGVRDYYEYARDRDLYLSYVIIDPQGDRSKSRGEGGNADLTVSVCDEDADGLTLRGAKMLGTGAVLSDEILVSTLRPMKEGEEKWAFTAMLPMNAPGLKILSRRSYEAAANSDFDYPLSARFDENDALIFFDDVRVSWDRVFVNGDIRTQFAQWHDTPAHSYQNYQAEIRLMVKLRFLVGLARRITETTASINFPQVMETLGELSAQLQMIEAFVLAMEVKGWRFGEYYLPDRELLYASQVHSQALYPKIVQTLRDLAGGGMIMLPSSVEDFANPELASLIGRSQYSPAVDSIGRVKLFKLAWDAIGSEFGSRHTQYEMFYSGPKVVTTGMAFRTFDWDRATALVDRCLESFNLPGDAPAADTQ